MERIEAEQERRRQLSQTNNIQPENKKITYSNIWQKIFSVKNECFNNKKYKVITILCIKFKVKRG